MPRGFFNKSSIFLSFWKEEVWKMEQFFCKKHSGLFMLIFDSKFKMKKKNPTFAPNLPKWARNGLKIVAKKWDKNGENRPLCAAAFRLTIWIHLGLVVWSQKWLGNAKREMDFWGFDLLGVAYFGLFCLRKAWNGSAEVWEWLLDLEWSCECSERRSFWT